MCSAAWHGVVSVFFPTTSSVEAHRNSKRTDIKVAPGMEVCYVVTFKPQEVRAYSVELMVVTEREKFVVPVGALGHRAVLDFPDQACFMRAFARALSRVLCRTQE